MFLFPKASIKQKQALIVLLTSSAALLLACSAFVGYELVTFRQQMQGNLQQLARQMASQNTSNLAFDEPEAAREILKSLSSSHANIMSAAIYDANGDYFAGYQRPDQSGRPLPVPSPDVRFGWGRLDVIQAVDLDNKSMGIVYLQSDLRPMYNRLFRYGSIVGVVLFLSLLVALLLSSKLQRMISGPILHLLAVAHTVSRDRNYSLRAEKHAHDELGLLTDGFNEMLAQIEARDEALRLAQSDLEKRVVERTRELELEVAERRRAEQALHHQLTRIRLLNQITQAISERQDIESIAQVILRQLEDHLSTDFGSLLLCEKSTHRLTVSSVFYKVPPKQAPLRSGLEITAEELGLSDCLRHKSIAPLDMSAPGAPRLAALEGVGLHSLLAAPLVVEDAIIGVLLAGRSLSSGFTSEEGDFLRNLSKHVALAAHQAKLHSELLAAYEELRQTQQAVMQQERLRALGEMASGIAHDINNALSPVVVYSELLQRSEDHLSAPGRQYLSHIKTAGEDIAHIVARMRDFYRRRDNTDELTAVQLAQIVSQVVEMTRPRWKDIPQQRGVVIEMQMEVPSDLPCISGNESEVREALTNLILNAVDAMPAGGCLTIGGGVVKDERAGGKAVEQVFLDIGDTGVGMNEETRTRCLEPFFSTKGQRGTGLGLAMVYGVMERHEGRIDIFSAPGRGTTMRLLFPVQAGSTTAAPAPEKPAAPVAPLRILCVDDEPLLRQLLGDLLQAEGHSVITAENGRIALDEFRTASLSGCAFDIVITDLGMPHLDGRQLAAILKSESPGTPIVMLTGWGAMMKSDGDLPAQVDAVLSKPPRIGEIRKAILRLVPGPGAGSMSRKEFKAHLSSAS